MRQNPSTDSCCMELFIELQNSSSNFLNSKVRAWIVPVPGEFHASEAVHLVAAADKDGDNVLSKEEVDPQKSISCLIVFRPFFQGGGCVQDFPGLAGD